VGDGSGRYTLKMISENAGNETLREREKETFLGKDGPPRIVTAARSVKAAVDMFLAMARERIQRKKRRDGDDNEGRRWCNDLGRPIARWPHTQP
jgi:hypothetical protein